MTIHNLQQYLETNVPGACVPVDLLRIAQSATPSRSTEFGLVGRSPQHRVSGRYLSGRRQLRVGVGRRGGNINLSRGSREHFLPHGYGDHGGRNIKFHPRRRSGYISSYDRPGQGRHTLRDSHYFEGQYSDQGISGHGWPRVRGASALHGMYEEKPLPIEGDPRCRSGSLPSYFPSHAYPMSLYQHPGPAHGILQHHWGPHYPQPHHGQYPQPARDDSSGSDYYYHGQNPDDSYMPTYHQAHSEPWSHSPGYAAEEWTEYSGQGRAFDLPFSAENETNLWFGDVLQSEHYRSGQSESEQLSYNREGTSTSEHAAEQPFSLVLDAEGCMDRLYGGYYSDWVCGGQWGRMLEFLSTFFSSIRSHDLHISVHFNGALEPQRMRQWVEAMKERRTNINSVLRHVSVQGSPPPKVWWVPPVGLQSALRLALRHLNVNMMVSMEDHHQEVIGFCRENCYDGVLGADAEYIAFDPPRYFSSQHLKLTYKGTLETVEFLMAEVCRSLSIPRPRLCLLAALLPNFLMSERDFAQFYSSLAAGSSRGAASASAAPASVSPVVGRRGSSGDLVQGVCNFISSRCCAPLSDSHLPALAAAVFGHCKDPRCGRLCAAVQYFLNGTQEGFLRYQHSSSGRLRLKGDVSSTPALPSEEPGLSSSMGQGTSGSVADRVKKIRSASVPAVIITVEPESPQAESAEVVHRDSTASSDLSSTQSVPTIVTASRPLPTGGAHAAGSATSSAVPLFSSASPKLRTRRHNSVPLLRNIPIICETVEEEVSDAQDSQTKLPCTRNSSAAATRHQSIPEVILSDDASSAVASESSNIFGSSTSSANKSLDAFGKRFTCPLIKVSGGDDIDQIATFRAETSAVQVPRIVIEASDLKFPERRSPNGSNSDEEHQKAFDIPSIDVTAANDDTDVEEDLEEVEAETGPPEDPNGAESASRFLSFDEKANSSRTQGSEGAKSKKHYTRCKRCGKKKERSLERGPSPNSSSGSMSPDEQEQSFESKIDKLKLSDPVGSDVPSLIPNPRELVTTTSETCTGAASVSVTPRDVQSHGDVSGVRKASGTRCSCSSEQLDDEDKPEVGSVDTSSQNNSLRRRKFGQVHETDRSVVGSSIETASDKRYQLERTKSSSSMVGERVARTARTQSIPCITTPALQEEAHLGAAAAPGLDASGDVGASLSPSSPNATCTSPGGKLTLPSSRKASDETSICSSCRRLSGSSCAAPELLGFHICGDDATTCSNFSDASSRRTSNASVAADLSMSSPNSAYPPDHQGFGSYCCDSSSVGSSPNASRRVSSASVGEGASSAHSTAGGAEHDPGGGCLSTASGSPGASLLLSSSSSSSNSSAASPYRLTPDACWLGHHYRSASPDSGASDTSDTIGGPSNRPRRASSSFSPSPTSPTPPSPLHRRPSPTLSHTPPPSTDAPSLPPASGTSATVSTAPPVIASGAVSRSSRARASSLPCDLLPKLPEEGAERDHSWEEGTAEGRGALLPSVAPEILRTASERHQKGLMHPWIYQLLTQGEVKLPPYLEEEVTPSYATFCDFYRPLRQHVYAILFNLYHLTYTISKKSNKSDKGDGSSEVQLRRSSTRVSFNPNTVVISGSASTPSDDASSSEIYSAESPCGRSSPSNLSESAVIDCPTEQTEPLTTTEADLADVRSKASVVPDVQSTERRISSAPTASLDSGSDETEYQRPVHFPAAPAATDERSESGKSSLPVSVVVTDSVSIADESSIGATSSSSLRDTAELAGSTYDSDVNVTANPSKPATTKTTMVLTKDGSFQREEQISSSQHASEPGATTAVHSSLVQKPDQHSSKPDQYSSTYGLPGKDSSTTGNETPLVVIREWVYSASNVYETPLMVPAVLLSWPVPTVNRLWFGCSKDDSKRRLRAFLSCLRSDAPLMLQPCCVPPRLRLLAAVLRYLLSSSEGCALTRQELDAFLVTAFSGVLPRTAFLQELQLPSLSSRGVQVASLLMAGVETAIFANDACGGPLAWWLVTPWTFFDGKLFHYTLLRAYSSPSLLELCDNDLELVSNVESCRRAILENLNFTFAKVYPHDFPHPLHPLHPALSSGAGTVPRHQQQQQQQQQHQQQQQPQQTIHGQQRFLKGRRVNDSARQPYQRSCVGEFVGETRECCSTNSYYASNTRSRENLKPHNGRWQPSFQNRKTFRLPNLGSSEFPSNSERVNVMDSRCSLHQAHEAEMDRSSGGWSSNCFSDVLNSDCDPFLPFCSDISTKNVLPSYNNECLNADAQRAAIFGHLSKSQKLRRHPRKILKPTLASVKEECETLEPKVITDFPASAFHAPCERQVLMSTKANNPTSALTSAEEDSQFRSRTRVSKRGATKKTKRGSTLNVPPIAPKDGKTSTASSVPKKVIILCKARNESDTFKESASRIVGREQFRCKGTRILKSEIPRTRMSPELGDRSSNERTIESPEACENTLTPANPVHPGDATCEILRNASKEFTVSEGSVVDEPHFNFKKDFEILPNNSKPKPIERNFEPNPSEAKETKQCGTKANNEEHNASRSGLKKPPAYKTACIEAESIEQTRSVRFNRVKDAKRKTSEIQPRKMINCIPEIQHNASLDACMHKADMSSVFLNNCTEASNKYRSNLSSLNEQNSSEEALGEELSVAEQPTDETGIVKGAVTVELLPLKEPLQLEESLLPEKPLPTEDPLPPEEPLPLDEVTTLEEPLPLPDQPLSEKRSSDRSLAGNLEYGERVTAASVELPGLYLHHSFDADSPRSFDFLDGIRVEWDENGNMVFKKELVTAEVDARQVVMEDHSDNTSVCSENEDRDQVRDENETSERLDNTHLALDEENFSLDGENLFLEHENLPVDDENLPVDDENLPVDDENLPVEDENLPVEDENLPVEDENLPVEDENLPVEIENLPVEDENLPVEDENLPVEDENLPVEDENLPVEDENLLVEDENLPVEVENLLVNEENLPLDYENLPFHDESLGFDGEKLASDNENLTFEDRNLCSESKSSTGQNISVHGEGKADVKTKSLASSPVSCGQKRMTVPKESSNETKKKNIVAKISRQVIVVSADSCKNENASGSVVGKKNSLKLPKGVACGASKTKMKWKRKNNLAKGRSKNFGSDLKRQVNPLDISCGFIDRSDLLGSKTELPSANEKLKKHVGFINSLQCLKGQERKLSEPPREREPTCKVGSDLMKTGSSQFSSFTCFVDAESKSLEDITERGECEYSNCRYNNRASYSSMYDEPNPYYSTGHLPQLDLVRFQSSQNPSAHFSEDHSIPLSKSRSPLLKSRDYFVDDFNHYRPRPDLLRRNSKFNELPVTKGSETPGRWKSPAFDDEYFYGSPQHHSDARSRAFSYKTSTIDKPQYFLRKNERNGSRVKFGAARNDVFDMYGGFRKNFHKNNLTQDKFRLKEYTQDYRHPFEEPSYFETTLTPQKFPCYQENRDFLPNPRQSFRMQDEFSQYRGYCEYDRGPRHRHGISDPWTSDPTAFPCAERDLHGVSCCGRETPARWNDAWSGVRDFPKYPHTVLYSRENIPDIEARPNAYFGIQFFKCHPDD